MIFKRTRALLGTENFNKLQNTNIAVIGIGGVGSASILSLVRTGVKNLIIMDYDKNDITNINRQQQSFISNIGEFKAKSISNIIYDINKDINLIAINDRYSKENKNKLFKYKIDYIIDAIDIVTNKLELIEDAQENSIKIISALGAGNKLDPTKVQFSSIYKTSICPLARVIRKKSKLKNIKDFPVVYSTESSKNIIVSSDSSRNSPASYAIVPNIFGYYLSYWIINNIIKS